MNARSILLTEEKFAVDNWCRVRKTSVLLRGEGRHTDDLSRLGQLYGVMVRSRIAHGVLRAVDDAARDMPGVRAITAADLDAAGIRDARRRWETSRTIGQHATPVATAAGDDRMSASRSLAVAWPTPGAQTGEGRRRGDLR